MAEPVAGVDAYSNFSALFILLFTICGFLLPMVIVYPPVPPQESDFLRETHTKLGLEPSASKLKKRPASSAQTAQRGMMATIQSLWVYPVKSCRGIEVTKNKVLPWGLEFDRLFTFAQLKSPFPVRLDSPDSEKSKHRWEIITQRQFPLLATVDVELWQPDVAKSKKSGLKISDSFIVLRFPWRDDGIGGVLSWIMAKLTRGLRAQPEKAMVLPVNFPSQKDIDEKGYTYEEVTIWRDRVRALNMEVELAPELQLYLGVSNKMALFRVNPDELRQIYRCAPRVEEAGYQPVTGFQDAVRLP